MRPDDTAPASGEAFDPPAPRRPKYVHYEDRRWRVVSTEKVNGTDWYGLRSNRLTIIAPITDCVPDDRPPMRRFRFENYILEFEPITGICWIRKRKERRGDRNRTSLEAIHSMTTKAYVAMQKSLRKAKRRSKRR